MLKGKTKPYPRLQVRKGGNSESNIVKALQYLGGEHFYHFWGDTTLASLEVTFTLN